MEKTIEQLLKDLQSLRNEFNDFLYFLPDALLEIDIASRRLTYMNRMAVILFGYSDTDFAAGIEVSSLFDGDDYERAVSIIKGYVEKSRTEKTAYERSGRTALYEFKMRRKNGEIFAAETQTSFVLNNSYLPIAMRTIVRDISNRREPRIIPIEKNAPRGRNEEATVEDLLADILRQAEFIAAQVSSDSSLGTANHRIIQSARRLAENAR